MDNHPRSGSLSSWQIDIRFLILVQHLHSETANLVLCSQSVNNNTERVCVWSSSELTYSRHREAAGREMMTYRRRRRRRRRRECVSVSE